MNRLLGASFALLVLAGCANNGRHVGLKNKAAMAAEAHGLWTRPTEVGFKMGGEITGTATSNRVLGFNVGEAKPNVSLPVPGILGGAGGRISLDPVEEFAAYKAVEDAKAEGIYLTRVEEESNGFLFFYRTRTVTVYGRALTLENYGPISEKRADQWRFRGAMPEVVVVKEGKADIMLPVDVK
jgi:hypothetical protein